EAQKKGAEPRLHALSLVRDAEGLFGGSRGRGGVRVGGGFGAARGVFDRGAGVGGGVLNRVTGGFGVGFGVGHRRIGSLGSGVASLLRAGGEGDGGAGNGGGENDLTHSDSVPLNSEWFRPRLEARQE